MVDFSIFTEALEIVIITFCFYVSIKHYIRLQHPIYKHLESLSDDTIKDIIEHALIETHDGNN